MNAKPYLNLGCGKTHLPALDRPPGHEIVPPQMYAYPNWINIDKVEGVGADYVFDLFTYPWPLEDNCASGALCAHILEHIPHEIILRDGAIKPHEAERFHRLSRLQDGWYAFWAELYRVLEHGSMVYTLAPYGWSDGAITDPSHTRFLTANTFTHGLQSGDSRTFRYETDCNFAVAAQPVYRVIEMFQHLTGNQIAMQNAMMTNINVVYDFCMQLQVVKDGRSGNQSGDGRVQLGG